MEPAAVGVDGTGEVDDCAECAGAGKAVVIVTAAAAAAAALLLAAVGADSAVKSAAAAAAHCGDVGGVKTATLAIRHQQS